MLQDHTLRIENVQASDAGVYICTAENMVGSVEAVAHLRVECKFIFICMYLHLQPKINM